MAENEKNIAPVKPTEQVKPTEPVKVETTSTPTPEKTNLTPEELQEEILNETLLKYGVDLREFVKDKTKCDLSILQEDLEKTGEEQLIEQKAKELYKNYLENELNKGKIEETVNLETVSNGVNSEKIQNLKNEYDKIIDALLNKYDFFDTQTKNFIKLGIANSVLKSSTSQIGDSLIGGINTFIQSLGTIDPNNLNSWLENKSDKTKDSGRTLALEEQFKVKLEEYFKKFNELNKRFEEKGITDETQKKNIISHVDWFRDPALIEKGSSGLDIEKIDFSKISKNETPLDKKALSEYMATSRENLVALSKKMDLGDKAGNLLYGIINDGGMMGDGIKSLVEMILEIPILGKLFAIFLGLDPNNAKVELGENVNNFKLLNSLKSLGKIGDKQGEKPFEEIDMSGISFNMIKKELKEFRDIAPDLQEDNYKDFWLKSFSENGYGEKEPKIKLKLDDEKLQDYKITNTEFKEILKKGVSDYKEEKEKIEKAKKEEVSKDKQAGEDGKDKQAGEDGKDKQAGEDGKDKQVGEDGKDKQVGEDGKDKQVGEDGKDKQVGEDGKDKQVGEDGKDKQVGEDGKDKQAGEDGKDKQVGEDGKDKQVGEDGKDKQVGEDGKDKQVGEDGKDKQAGEDGKDKQVGEDGKDKQAGEDGKDKQVGEDGKDKQAGEGEKPKTEKEIFAEEVGKKIEGITTETKLTNGLNIGDGKDIIFNKNTQMLKIGKNIYDLKINVDGKNYKLNEIKIDSKEEVTFFVDILNLGEDISCMPYKFSKDTIKNGIKELITKDSFSYEKDKNKLTLTKIA